MERLRVALAASAAALLAPALWAGPALADEPTAVVRGDLPADLRDAIDQAVGTSEDPPESRLEARRRAREAAEDVIAVLRSEGYYDNVVLPDIGEGETPQPVVDVTVGPRFRLADPKIAWQGPEPLDAVKELGQAAMDLEPGEAGRAADVVAAEGRIVAAIQKSGYADAAPAPREVIVDWADQTVRPEYRIAAGDLVILDGIDLRTAGRTNPAWVHSLVPWKAGEVYDPEDVAELERRLLDAGVYESVTVALAPKESIVNGERPVLVSLADRPRGTIELGAGYSTSEGAGLDGRWLRYNQLGRADTLMVLFRLAEIERRLEAELSLPHWRRPQRTLKVGAAIFQDATDAYNESGANVRADVTRRYGKTSFLTLGASLEATRTDERLPFPRTRDLVTLTGLSAFAWDRSSDPLDPKHGWRLDSRAEPTLSTGDDDLAYLRVQAQVSAYWPFGDAARTVAAGRVKLGTAAGASLEDLPAARRFYAGGGGSVRGYTYQGVGPRLEDNTPIGGLSLFEASIEVRHEMTRRWGMAAFVDVGSVGPDETPNFDDVSIGAGVGVRYNLGFGPIRADIAVPLDKRSGDPGYQIYLSIGQSF